MDQNEGCEPGGPSPIDGPPVLTIEVHGRQNGGATLLKVVSGAMTGPGARVLKSRVAQLMGSNPLRVWLDLSGLTFIDEAGLGELLDAQKGVLDAGGEFELADPSALVVRLLHAAVVDWGPG